MTYECYCDYDQPEFCVTSRHKARVPFKCYECRRDVPVGERYQKTVGKWDGSLSTFKLCSYCDEILQWAFVSVPCFCHGFGGLYEEIREMVAEVRRDVPGFFFEYGRRIIALRRAGGHA